MDNLPRPGHVSKDRLVSSGAANVGDQTSAVASDLAAPSQAVLTYDELLDARQVARAVQASWGDHSKMDDELASLWPLARVPDEPLKEEDWQCIMRHRNAVAQLVECGHQNHWYVRQCVQCDASRWDIELRARVSAILQTSRIEQTSTRQVINRLKAFSSGPPGLSPAFTTAMVQQAIDDCLALQADTAERKRTLHASKSGGAVTRETHLDRPIRGPIEGQSQLAEQLMAAAGLPSASEEMTCPAGSDQQGRNEPDASKPIEQEWGSTALALHQALSALAPSQSLPGTQRPTAHPGHSCQATTVASTSEPPQAEGASNQLNSSELSQTQQTGVDGTSAAVSADLQGAKCTGADVQRSQTAVAQGYHFATDLLEAVLRQQGKKVHTGYTSDLPAVWVRPRKPSQLAVTASQQHRKLFQMPALPKHQSQQATWKTPTTPAISIDYPIPSSHMAAGATEPSAQPEPSGGDNNKKRRRAATNSSLHPSCADLQEADMEARHQAEAQGLRQHAEGGLGSSAGGNSGNEAHCNPQGLKPTPVARALAGPTVHILVEGYDVYTKSGIGLTRGNAFPASEVTKVSQNSRHLWLRQRPFQLKRSTAEELATGAYRKGSGTKNNKPNKVDTVKIALDRQLLTGLPSSIGNAQHKSAFHSFADPSTSSLPPNDPSSTGAAISSRPGSVPRAEAEGNMSHLEGRPIHISNAMDVPEPGSKKLPIKKGKHMLPVQAQQM
ncbi:hypothetical protein WJX79_008332 [Trebouxia sp. C0005]